MQEATALVTGANRGIGRAIVGALLERGIKKVYATARDAAGVAADPRVLVLRLDITDAEQVAAAASIAGDVTLLVNNGGSLEFADLLAGDLAAIETDLRTNYLGTLAVTRAFVPVLRANGGGAIVNMLSLVALGAVRGMGGYSVSKAAAASMTQAVRAQVAGLGITVHGVFPGAVDTDMIRAFDMPKADPADVARTILDGVEAGAEDIFPDPMARDGHRTWRTDPKILERQMAAI
ncbi:SDR family oxidoreductase [Paractinoplanes ferrugineus]|uniref:SDR family oxidoreductase n=1 Tax=Paractinoplanes ferrugineus TaxID=113564 RepID=UPI001EF25278|nr:SDR family oxidoreductase [Actinoplanes ferrugineus]